VTLPTPDAQSPRFLSQQTHSSPPTHSIRTLRSLPTTPTPSTFPSPSLRPSDSGTEFSDAFAHERATNFATHSWDPATGGLKTLTAKRELPPRLERRATDQLSETPVAPRSYIFPLVILTCIVVMLISGGIVLYMMLQP